VESFQCILPLHLQREERARSRRQSQESKPFELQNFFSHPHDFQDIPMTTGMNPSFLLRGVDPEQVINELLRGDYKSTKEVPKSSVSSSLVSHANEAATSDRSAERLAITIGRHKVYIVTTEQRVFYAQLGCTRTPPILLCKWCRLRINSSWVGIPINHVKKGQEEYFYTTGTYCCYSCAYAHLRCILSQYRASSHSSKYINSEQYLKYLFHQQYPNKQLHASPDWNLLEDNGGPLSREDFFAQSSSYVPLPSMKIVPTKCAYWNIQE
jgi:hypothetical protein